MTGKIGTFTNAGTVFFAAMIMKGINIALPLPTQNMVILPCLKETPIEKPIGGPIGVHYIYPILNLPFTKDQILYGYKKGEDKMKKTIEALERLKKGRTLYSGDLEVLQLTMEHFLRFGQLSDDRCEAIIDKLIERTEKRLKREH